MKLVTVATFSTPGAAALAQTQLDDAGIASVVENASNVGTVAMFAPDAAAVRLRVTAVDADDARAVLDATDAPGT